MTSPSPQPSPSPTTPDCLDALLAEEFPGEVNEARRRRILLAANARAARLIEEHARLDDRWGPQ